MTSRPCKVRVRNILIWSLVIMMLFGLFGCGKVNHRSEKLTPEQAVLDYLHRTYGGEFAIEELSRKGMNMPIPDSFYSGTAYEVGKEDYLFAVWVSKDLKTVEDAYAMADLLPQIDAWLQERADIQWQGTRVRDELSLRNTTGITAKTPEEYFETGKYLNYMTMLMPAELRNSEELPGQMTEFLRSIGKAGGGILTVYFVEADQIKEISFRETSKLEAESIVFSLSDSEETVNNRLSRER